jgi:long-chain acyl-CoA synthetase
MEFKETYTIPKMIKDSADKYAEINAQYKRQKNGEFIPVLYREMFQLGLDF